MKKLEKIIFGAGIISAVFTGGCVGNRSNYENNMVIPSAETTYTTDKPYTKAPKTPKEIINYLDKVEKEIDSKIEYK